MTNDSRYAQAYFGRQSIVFGKRLEPLTIGHWLLLEASGSPFAPGALRESITASECLEAILICSSTYEISAGRMRDGLSFREKVWSLSAIAACVIGNLLEARVMMVLSHIASGFNGPRKYTDQIDGAAKSGIPHILGLKRVLMSAYGYSESEVLNMTVARALWEGYSTHEALSNGVTLATEDDYARAEAAI